MSTDLKASVVSGVKWLAFSKTVIQLFRWASTFWVIRLLTADDYGVMAIAEIMAALLVSVNYLCIGNAIIRFKAISKSILNTLFTFCLVIGFLLFIIQFFSASYFAKFYTTPEAELVLQVIAVAYLIECFNVKPMALLAKELKFKQLAKIDLIVGLLMPIAVLTCAYMGMGYWALAVGHIVNAVMKTIVANYMKPTPLSLGFRFKRTLPMMKFGAQNAASSIISQINSSLDFIIGGYYLSTSQIGIYQVGLQVSFIPLRKVSPELRRISFPAFSKVSANRIKVIEYYLKSNRLISLVIFPVFWGLGFIAEPLISVLLTEKWIESAIVIQILCFILPFKLLSEMSGSMLNALGRADILLVNTIFTTVIFLASIFILLDEGISGLAYAWVISILVSYLALLIRIARVLPITIVEIVMSYKASFLGSSVMIFCLYVVSKFVSENSLFSLLSYIAVGFTIYVSYVLLFHKKMLKELKRLIKG